MVRIYVITLGLVLMLAGSTRADHITLKVNFITGWRYSLNGGFWRKCGFHGDGLRSAMAGHKDAQAEMGGYKNWRAGSLMSRLISGAAICWWSAEAARDDTRRHDWLLAVALPLALIRWICDSMATGKIQRAVRIYNGEEQALQLDTRYDYGRHDDDGTFKVMLTCGL